MLTTQVVRIAVQAAYFIAIARGLGSDGLGQFISVAALAGIVAPFATWGAGDLLVQSTARDPSSFAESLGRAILTVLLVGSFLAAGFTFAAIYVLPKSIPPLLVGLILSSELCFAPMVTVAGHAYQSFERLVRTGGLWLSLSLLRLLAAVALVCLFDEPTALQWAALYLTSTIIAATLAIALVAFELGRPTFHLTPKNLVTRQGFFFSVTLSAAGMTNDIDKTMLATLATVSIAGVYAAGYRVAELAFVPITALLHSSYARFFQAGAEGIARAHHYAKRLLPPTLAYSLFAATALWIVSPLLPRILGAGFDDSTTVVRWLALLPLIRALGYLAAHALTGAGYQATRGLSQLAAAVLNVALNAVLIPVYGWTGAVLATITAEAALAICLWGAVLHILSALHKSLDPDTQYADRPTL